MPGTKVQWGHDGPAFKVTPTFLLSVPVEFLRPGMTMDVWFQDRGAASVVRSVEVIPATGGSRFHEKVKVTMCDGTVFRLESGFLPLKGINRVGVWPYSTETAQVGLKLLQEVTRAR